MLRDVLKPILLGCLFAAVIVLLAVGAATATPPWAHNRDGCWQTHVTKRSLVYANVCDARLTYQRSLKLIPLEE